MNSSTSSPSAGPRVGTRLLGFLGGLVRIGIPALLLYGGYSAFQRLSIPEDEVEEEEQTPQLLRTRVTPLHAGEYQVTVKTNGFVLAHNEILLSAQVSGRVQSIHPSFETGAFFEKGDVLVKLDDSDYRTMKAVAEARLQSAESAAKLAQTKLSRIRQLTKTRSASDTELEDAIAQAALTAAELKIAKGDWDQKTRDLERTSIVAPFAGRVRSKTVGIGELVASGSPIGGVFAIDFAEVRLPISSRQIKHLRLPERTGDLPVPVELRDSVEPDSTWTWTGSIVRTEGAVDEQSLEVFAIARIVDPFGIKSGRPALRIGQPVTATILGETLQDVIAMPRSAVRQLDQVILVDKDNLTLQSLTIRPLWSDENNVLVRDESIADGTFLATTRLVYAPDGSKIEIIPDVPSDDSSATAMVTD